MVTLFARLADDLFAKQCRKPHRWSALAGAADRSAGIFVSAGPENDKKKKKKQQNKTDAPIVHTTTAAATTELVVTSRNREFLHGRIYTSVRYYTGDSCWFFLLKENKMTRCEPRGREGRRKTEIKF